MQISPAEGTGKFNDLRKEREVVLLISVLEHSKVLLTEHLLSYAAHIK